jgi:hypothetical protein
MGYVSIADIRAEGLTDAQRFPDERVQAQIDLWSGFVERATRQWFEPRPRTLIVDGNDTDTLQLPVPIISVSQLYINADFITPVRTDLYFAYTGRDFPDDRKNPRIRLLSTEKFADIFLPPRVRTRGEVFIKSRQNQKVVGVFGFVEADGSTPALIKRAVTKLVLANVRPLFKSSVAMVLGKMMEQTDGHMVQYLTPDRFKMRLGTLGITRDMEVEQILQLYRAPILLGSPGSATFVNG